MKLFRMMAAALGLMLFAGHAMAATVGFANISGGTTEGDPLVGRFSLDISDVSTLSVPQVLIKVISAAGRGGHFIGGIFIDDDPRDLLKNETRAFRQSLSVGRVNFAYASNRGDLPQGSSIQFDKTSKYLFKNGSSYGVQSGETAAFVFKATYADVIAAFQAGTLRFGLHVQGIDLPGCKDGSDSFVSHVPPPAIPLPASGLLLLAGIGGLIRLRRR